MKKRLAFLFILFLWTGRAGAALFGDLLVPDDLHPVLHSEPGHNNRLAVIVTLPGGDGMVLYLPRTADTALKGTVLQTIARNIVGSRELAVYNLGGRPWFGSRQVMPGGVTFYDGYTHRNNVIYNVAFSMDDMETPDNDAKQALARIWLLPGLNSSPAVHALSKAADLVELGQWEDAATYLDLAQAADPGCWAVFHLRGRIAEMREDPQAALSFYRIALGLEPNDVETAVRAAAMEGLTDNADNGVNRLADLGQLNPEEATVWEELGMIYLMAEQTDIAKSYFEEAIAVNPGSEAGLYNLSFIYAQEGNYEDALRRAREFMHYRPWMPNGIVPDVTTAPGMTQSRVREILGEPLPIGHIASYGFQTIPLTATEIQRQSALIPAQILAPAYQVETYYVPIVNYVWSWSPRSHRPWRPGYVNHPPRPPQWGHGPSRPPAHLRPPKPPEPPNRPGNRPPGNRPPGGGGRPPSGGPGGRPPGSGGPGSRPPENGGPGARPPADGGSARPPSGITTLPAPLPDTSAPSRPEPPSSGSRPNPDERPGENNRPGNGSRPGRPDSGSSSGITTLPAPVQPPSGQVKPAPDGNASSESGSSRPAPSRPAPAQPVPSRPAPSRPAPSPGAPSTPVPSRPVPSRPTPSNPALSRPAPSPAQPAPSRPVPSRPAPFPAPSRPAPSPSAPSTPVPSRPAPSRPAPPKPAPSRPTPAPAQPAPSQPAPSRPAPSKPAPFPAPNRPTPRPVPTPAPRQQPEASRPSRSGSSESRPASDPKLARRGSPPGNSRTRPAPKPQEVQETPPQTVPGTGGDGK